METKKGPAISAVSVLTAAALWGLVGMWTRVLMAGGLSPMTITALRNPLCTVLMCLVFLVKDRSVFHVRREHVKYFLGTGAVSVTLFSVCLFTCQKLCSLAVASVLSYTAPSFVVLLSAILWKEPVTKRKAAALALTLIGACCVCGLFDRGLSVTVPGILMGLGAGLSYALYNIFGHGALEHYGPMTVTVWTFLVAGPTSLLLLRPSELVPAFGSAPWLLLVLLGLSLFSTMLPYFFYTWGLSGMEPGRASILTTSDVVVTVLVGTLLFGEPLTASTVIGILCVLAGIYILR